MQVKRYLQCLLTCLAVTSLTAVHSASAEPKLELRLELRLELLVEAVVDAANRGEPGPVFAKHQGLTLEQAYQVQTLAVKQRLAGATPQGFKAGLTSEISRKKFAVAQPVAGVLLAGGRELRGRGEVDMELFNNMMFEMELGFTLSETITAPIADVATLKTIVAKIYPVIELPDLAFDRPKNVTGVDIVANNVAAKQFYFGAGINPDSININQLTVQLKKDGINILKGRGDDAMDDQWQALLWLVNRTVSNGWDIEPGQLLITGALGKMIKASPGIYQVDYGELGRLELNVQ